MKQAESEPPRRGRPRSEAARAAALEAARALLAEAGPARLTIEAVAARAGVGKPTIYRHWANAQELAMAALMEAAPKPEAPAAPKGLAALSDLLEETAARLASREGRQAAQMLAAADPESELFRAFRNRAVLDGRRRARTHLLEAMAAGEARDDLDPDLALDLLFGALYLRVLLAHAPLSPGFAAEALRLALEGAAPRPID